MFLFNVLEPEVQSSKRKSKSVRYSELWKQAQIEYPYPPKCCDRERRAIDRMRKVWMAWMQNKQNDMDKEQKTEVVSLIAGGVVGGPPIGTIHTYEEGKNNPEVVAPLTKLKALLNKNEDRKPT